MATVRRFEDLDAWKQARELNKVVYAYSKRGSFAKDFALRDQIRRAAISIMSNIGEGFERGGDKEFMRFLAVAKGSCGEVRSQLFIALDQEYLSRRDFEAVYRQCLAVNKLISGLLTYLNKSKMNGRRGLSAHNENGAQR